MIRKIYLSIDKQGRGVIDYTRESTDVIVEMENGDTYVASFFTYNSLSTMIDRNKVTGEYLNGKYYWVEGMVLIDKCALEDIKEVVNYLIEEGDFIKVFEKI